MNSKSNDWARAKKLCRLNDHDIRMAKELGLGARSLIKNIPSKNQPWKAPVKEWIRDLYAKKFGRNQTGLPQDSSKDKISPEQWDELLESIPLKIQWRNEERPFDEARKEEYSPANKRPTDEDIEEQNLCLLRRQKFFRMAADYFAREASQFIWVMKVALLGSVAQPLIKEVPRFRDYRRYGIEVWHECKDVDVAVWVNQLSELDALRKARAAAVNKLLNDTEGLAGVAHHQLDVFILDYERNLYMGNLCIFKTCPSDKPACQVQGCGAAPFLQRYEDFHFHSEAIGNDRTKILFDRSPAQENSTDDDFTTFKADGDDEVPF